MKTKIICLLLFSIIYFKPAFTQKTFYVSPDGKDNWSGTIATSNEQKTDGPFASMSGARDAIRYLRNQGFNQQITVQFRQGNYLLSEPVIFKPEDSGLPGAQTLYTSFPGEEVTISGGQRIEGKWNKHKGNIWKIKISGNMTFNQLFVNGKRQTRARTPNEGYYNAYRIPKESRDSMIYQAGDIQKTWHDLPNVQVVIFHSWSESRLFIKSVDENQRLVTFTGPGAYALDFFYKYPRYWVENVFEGLDAPGEWYLDRLSGTLYYYPTEGIDLKNAEVIAPVANQLIQLKGDRPVRYLTFQNLSFRYTGYNFPETGYKNGGGSTGPLYRPSAILLANASNVTFRNCLIENTATYAIELTDSSTHCLFENNIIQHCGGGGIIIIGGSDNSVSNNHIHHCGEIFFGGTGVVNANGVRTRIAHNLIQNMPYCGVRGGDWGVKLDEIIEYNHIHHVMTMLNDGACVFNCGIGSIIRNNVVHDSYGFDSQGWGLYLDEFRTGVTMTKNISYNTRSGGLHLHNNFGHIITNNIFAYGKDVQISWTRFHGVHFNVRKAKYQHPIHTFQHNIVYWNKGVFSYNLDCNRWDLATAPEKIDYNLYYNAAPGGHVTMGIGHGGKPGYDTFSGWQEMGLDKHSLETDPLFKDPVHGDFTLDSASPAFKLGFEAIDVSQVGLINKNLGPMIK